MVGGSGQDGFPTRKDSRQTTCPARANQLGLNVNDLPRRDMMRADICGRLRQGRRARRRHQRRARRAAAAYVADAGPRCPSRAAAAWALERKPAARPRISATGRRQLRPVLPVRADVPRGSALRGRRGDGAPGPPGGRAVCVGGLNEVAGIGGVPELAADEPEPGQGSLDGAARCGVEGGEGAAVRPGVARLMAASTTVTHHTASVAAATACGTSAALAPARRRRASVMAVTDHASAPSPAAGPPSAPS